MRHVFRTTVACASLATALCAADAVLAEEPSPTLVATTTYFAFHSDFEVNLHDALLEAGRTRWSDKPELFHSGEESECFTKLSRAARSGWDYAVAFYAETVSPPQARDAQFAVRLDLIGVEQEDDAGRELAPIAGSIRAAAAPAYRACRWKTQDEENRAWVEQVVPLVEAHGDAIAGRLGTLYEKPLSGLPLRTDIVETVSWSSANTMYLTPEGGHIWISTRAGEGLLALETVFHEASHLLTGRGAPIPRALGDAGRALGLEVPRDLWHGAQFYVTGETVRRVLDESAGEPGASGYKPMMFDQDIFGEYHEVLLATWPGYLYGTKTLEEAARDLVRSVAEAGN